MSDGDHQEKDEVDNREENLADQDPRPTAA